jgi:tetratricopeptide (TPR) repeat protein
VDQAVVKFRQVLRERPDLAEAHYQLGLALLKKGETADAAAAFRTALERDPRRSDIRGELDRLAGPPKTLSVDDPSTVAALEAYFRDRRFVEVQPLLEEYLKGRPNSSWGWYALGYSLFSQQKLGESIKALSRSLSLNVANAEAHKVLGRTLMMIGRFEVAQVEFEQGEKYDPKSAEIPFNLGRLYSIQDQYLPAKAAFERSLRNNPQYMEAHDGLGFALEALGEDEAAIAAYQRSIQLNEARAAGYATPYINLSAYYNRKGETDAALEYARKAVAVNAKADRGYFQMARAHERVGEFDAAATALNRAIGINPRVASYYYVLSTIYRRQGKLEESRGAMEKFSKLNRESDELEERRRESLRPERAGRE